MISLQVWALTEYQRNGETRTNWTLVGRALKNKDGSLAVFLDCLPLSGKLQIRKRKDQEDDQG